PVLFSTPPPTPQLSTLSLHDALPIFTPQPDANTRLRSAGAPRALIGRISRDRRQFQAIHADGSIKRLHARQARIDHRGDALDGEDRKSTRLNSSHRTISYAVFCLKKK